jgi:integrase
MALRTYIRAHAPKCLRNLTERIAKKEIKPISKDDLMDYRHCRCGWWLYGSTDDGRVIKPMALKVYSYGEAVKKRDEINNSKPGQEKPITMAELCDLFLENRRGKKRTHGTVEDNYARVTKRFLAFCESLNPPLRRAKDVTPEHLMKWRSRLQKVNGGSLKKAASLNYYLGIMAMVFHLGVRRNKLTANPAHEVDSLTDAHVNEDDGAETEEGDNCGRTLPLDEKGDANYRKLLANASDFIHGKLVLMGRAKARRKTIAVFNDPERLVLLMELMYETGLRISDTIHFLPRKMKQEDDECFSYTTKQIKIRFRKFSDVTVFIPAPLAARLAALAPVHENGYIFYDGSQPWRRFISDTVYRTIRDLGIAVGLAGVRPHRFRDSFAVNRLNEGVTMENLKLMLGHNRVETTQRYYNPWVASRHEALKDTWKAGRAEGKRKAEAAAGVLPFKKKQR